MASDLASENRAFTSAVKKLFRLAQNESCAKYGELSQYMYASPNPNNANDLVDGAAGFAKLLVEPSYYLLTAGRNLLRTARRDIAQAFSDTFGEGRGYVCDLGPGPRASVENKLIPIMRAIGRQNLKGAILIDKEETYLEAGWDALKERFNGMPVTKINSAFREIGDQLEDLRNVLYLLLGNTGGNFETSRDVPNPFSGKFFESIRELVEATGGLVVIEQDCNQDEASLLAAYNNPAAEKWMKNLLHRMVRDAGVQFERPLDAEVSDFEYFARWNKDAYCMEMGVISKYDQTVKMGDDQFIIKAGTELHMWNSHKYPPKLFKKMLEIAGFKSQTIITDAEPGKPESGRSAIHVVGVDRHMQLAA